MPDLGTGLCLRLLVRTLQRGHALFLCRAGEGTIPEAQEGLHREDGGNPELVEEHRGPVCELVSCRGTHLRPRQGGAGKGLLGPSSFPAGL